MKEPWPKWLYDPGSLPARILNKILITDLLALAFGGLLAFMALYGFSGCIPAPRTGSAPGAEPLGSPKEERSDKCATSPKPH
jgi:hypothetical protein